MQLTKYPIEQIDQLGNKIKLENAPTRIVSTVPSITLTLIDLGLEKEVIARTKFCIHPKEIVKNIPKIGGTKTLDINKIIELNPDLIIANKEENEFEQIKILQEKFPVYISDVNDLESNYDFIEKIGVLTNTVAKANQIIKKTKANFNLFTNVKQKSVAYLIWKDPYMVAASDTFINSLLTELNLINVFAEDFSRYPEVTLKDIETNQPDLIFLSSEPYPFKEKHINEFKKAIPNTEIHLVDGEFFSWFGSKMQNASQYFNDLQQQYGNIE